MNVPILPTLKGNSPEEIRDWAQSLVNALVYELSNLTAGKVSSTTYVVDGVIGTDQLANDAVTNAKVADVAIDTAQLVDAAITTGKIADANVSTDKLASLAVTAAKLAGATTGTQINVSGIASGVCSTTNTQGLANGDYVRFGSGGTTAGGFYLVSNVVTNTSFTIDDATITDTTDVTCYEATEGAITYEKIANLAVGHTAIAAAAIGTAHIANLAVTEALIANLAVSSAKIAALAVEEAKINNLAVTAGKIGSLAVTNAKINDCAVDKLTAGSITSKAITLAISAGTGDVKMQAGRTDFGQTTNGFILGMDDSDSDRAKFEIGNGATRFFKFDGQDVSIGLNSKLEGVACYNNANVYYEDPLLAWSYTTGGAGAATNSQVNAGSTAGDYGLTIAAMNSSFVASLGWDKSKKFKVSFIQNVCTNATHYIIIGRAAPSTNGCGLKIVNGAAFLCAKNSDGESTTDLSYAITSGQQYTVEVEWTAGTSVRVAIATAGTWAVEATRTTGYLPTGTLYGDWVFTHSLYKDGNDANASWAAVFGLKWLQIGGAGGFVPAP